MSTDLKELPFVGPEAFGPKRGKPGDAGLDLFASQGVVLMPAWTQEATVIRSLLIIVFSINIYQYGPAVLAGIVFLYGILVIYICVAHPPQWRAQISAEIKVAIPAGCYGKIDERSSLALKDLAIGGGIIDLSYRGTVIVIVRNVGVDKIVIKPGDRIAQLIIQPYAELTPKRVESLDETERGATGFGSTGR